MTTNTENAGGTRFSAGKPKRTWAPFRALHYIWEVADYAAHNYIDCSDEETLDSIDECFQDALGDPLLIAEGDLYMVSHAAFMTLELLHRQAGGKLGDRRPVLGLDAVCEVSVMGAAKYAPFDYRNGQSFSTLLSCGHRHHSKAMNDQRARDAESGLLHLGHSAWNLLCLNEFIYLARWDLDDITPWRGITAAQKKQAEDLAQWEKKSVLDILRAHQSGERTLPAA